MNDLDHLKTFRADTPPPTPQALAHARRELLEPTRRAPRLLTSAQLVPGDGAFAGRRRLLVAGVLVLALAGGFLAADVVGRDGTAPAVADASTFLANSAAAADADPDEPIPPGQFLQITVRTSRLKPLGADPSLRATQYGEQNTWVPSDRKPPYVSTASDMTRVEFASPAARELARTAARYLFYPYPPSLEPSDCPTFGAVGFSVSVKCVPSWERPTYEFFAAQPRDPDRLLAALRTKPLVPDADIAAFTRVATVLRTGAVPADLRAALYQAVRKIPGIKLLDEAVTVDGRRARVIGRDAGGVRYDLLIAETGGQFLGTRIVATQDGPPDINGKPELSLRSGDVLNSALVTTRLTSTPPPRK